MNTTAGHVIMYTQNDVMTCKDVICPNSHKTVKDLEQDVMPPLSNK